MPREQRGDERGRPELAPVSRSSNMKSSTAFAAWNKNIDEMMRAGIQAEQFAVRHVRKPGERMPVARVAGGERPLDARPGQAVLDDGIFGDVIVVVIIAQSRRASPAEKPAA